MSAPDQIDSAPKPTIPPSISISLKNFGNADTAERLGNTIGAVVRTLSEWIDLARLDGITVSYNYDAALADLDRGYPSSTVLTRTMSDELVGVAMTPAVLRDSLVKAHMVFYAPAVLGLLDNEDTKNFRLALYLLAHECGHVENLFLRDTACPGTILQKHIPDMEYVVLDTVVDTIWDEYSACRVSAQFDKSQTSSHEESFTSVLRVAFDKANDAIRAYRLHSDIPRVLKEAGNPLCEPVRAAAYLLGHLHGIGLDMSAVPQTQNALQGSSYLELISSLEIELLKLWAPGKWPDRNTLGPIKNIVRMVLKGGGLILSTLPTGQLYVNIPFTPQTVPY